MLAGILVTLFRLTLFLALALFLVSFITSNTSSITIGLFPLPFEVDVPVYALGLGMLFSGLLAGGLIVSASRIAAALRYKQEKHKIEKKLQMVQHELESLRLEQNLYRKQIPAQTAK